MSSSNSSMQSKGGKRGGSGSRRNSKNSTGSRRSSRRSSGSICEADVLNTATVHFTTTTDVTTTSLPTLLSQNNGLQYGTSILQSLHIPTTARIPPLDGLQGIHSLPNPYMDQAYFLMESHNGLQPRDDFQGMEYHPTVTQPLRSSPSEEILYQNTDEGLGQVLNQNGCFETQEGMKERADIVKSLDILAKQWIRTTGLEMGLNYTVVEENQGMVLTYGSCKLEAADKDADMDLICVAPSYISRENFFDGMYNKLMKHEHVKELRRLPDVFVPVIKFKFKETEVDFTFARLNRTVPEKEEKLMEELFTESLDDRCLRSLNGYRATCEILNLVPDVRVFQQSLRGIKLWGKMNGLYGNILGYLGGASWAILVARTCQEQAKKKDVEHCPREVIFTFFQLFSSWKWPAPVYIRQVIHQPNSAWNPSINPADRDHAMPIITSSVPQMNSAVNINRPIQKYIQERMMDAHQTCNQIQNGLVGWEALFKPYPFYQEHEDFIKITGECETDSCFWFGCLESKFRYLKEKIESNSKIHSVRIWPKGFLRKKSHVSIQTWFIGLAGAGSLEKAIDEDLRVFKDRCYGDLRKNFGSSHLVQRAFSVDYSFVHRSEIFKIIPLKELHMGSVPRSMTYASVTQSGSATATRLNAACSNQSGYLPLAYGGPHELQYLC